MRSGAGLELRTFGGTSLFVSCKGGKVGYSAWWIRRKLKSFTTPFCRIEIKCSFYWLTLKKRIVLKSPSACDLIYVPVFQTFALRSRHDLNSFGKSKLFSGARHEDEKHLLMTIERGERNHQRDSGHLLILIEFYKVWFSCDAVSRNELVVTLSVQWDHIAWSLSVSGQLPTYPSPNPTLTLTCYQLTVVGLGEG